MIKAPWTDDEEPGNYQDWVDATPWKFTQTDLALLPLPTATQAAFDLSIPDEKNEKIGAILYGSPGTGKTRTAHLLSCWWAVKSTRCEIIEGPGRLVTFRANDLREILEKKRGKVSAWVEDTVRDALIILIDDLGEEDISHGALTYLSGLKRLMDGASDEAVPMIVTTNHGPTELANHWAQMDPACAPLAPKVASRLRRYFRPVKFIEPTAKPRGRGEIYERPPLRPPLVLR